MLIGDRLNLRAVFSSDKEKILTWANDPGLRDLTGGIFPVSDIEHELWFENLFKEKLNKTFGIELIEEKELIGIIGFKNINWVNRSAEIFIYLGDDKQRQKGYGKEAVNILKKFAFDNLNLHRLSLLVFSYNHNAINTYKKVGFLIEGTMRDAIFRFGDFHDVIIMGLIKEGNDHLWKKD